jgi:hypothetical protein
VLQETGSLLLWEGNFIKLEIAHLDGSLPHQGAVRVVLLDRSTKQLVTAGDDGCVERWCRCPHRYRHRRRRRRRRLLLHVLHVLPSNLCLGACCSFIRWWSFDAVDGAELEEDQPKFPLEPVTEVFLGDGVAVRGLAKSVDGSYW